MPQRGWANFKKSWWHVESIQVEKLIMIDASSTLQSAQFTQNVFADSAGPSI